MERRSRNAGPRAACLLLSAVMGAALSSTARAAIPASERAALEAFYLSTGGPGWVDNTGWRGPDKSQTTWLNECDWAGIKCDAKREHVIALTLFNNHLVGSVPDEIRNLTYLEEFGVGVGWCCPNGGDLTAQSSSPKLDARMASRVLPKDGLLGDSLALPSVDATSAMNQLSGSFPSGLLALKSLKHLELSWNQFSGPLPPELASLTNLEHVDLAVNKFVGEIPNDWKNLKKLQLLSLGNNPLSTGTIPKWLGELPSLDAIVLAATNRNGDIPDVWGKQAKLNFVDFSRNDLGGTIPRSLGAKLDDGSLRPLDAMFLYDNQLVSPLPDELFLNTQMNRLYLHRNKLDGPFPDKIYDMSQLRMLNLAMNGFSGELAPDLGVSLEQLLFLDLSGNRFSGEVPKILPFSVNYVDLSHNELTGMINLESPLYSVTYVNLADNHLVGPINPILSLSSGLRTLDLSSNMLGGLPPTLGSTFSGYDVPCQFLGLDKLGTDSSSYLDLSYNSLYSVCEGMDAFLAERHVGPGWRTTQTSPPENVTAGTKGAVPMRVRWTPTQFRSARGYYTVTIADAHSESPMLLTTRSKDDSFLDVDPKLLTPGRTYGITVSTFTEPHPDNRNPTWSADSDLAFATMTTPPAIRKVIASGEGSSLQLKVLGTNFSKDNAGVLINGAWAPVTRTFDSGTLYVEGGKALKKMLPKGVTVKLAVRNEDGGESDDFDFTR